MSDGLAARRLQRRRFLALTGSTAGALLIAACGGGGDSSTSSTGSGSTPAVSSPAKNVRLMTLPPSELGAPGVPTAGVSKDPKAETYAALASLYSGLGTDAGPGVFPRTVKHAMGTTTISKRPNRVVVLDTAEMDAVVDMGVKPVGTIQRNANGGYPAYLGGVMDGVKIVGSREEPSLEQIIGLSPDIIIANQLRLEKQYDKLSAIAPTVFGPRTGVVWKHNYELYAKALGREEEAAQTVLRYEDRVKALNKKLPSPRPSISLIRIGAGGATDLRYYSRSNYAGLILTDLGFHRPPLQNNDEFGIIGQSLETLGQYAPADVIVVSSIGAKENKLYNEMIQSPLWRGLPAVRNGTVIEVDDNTWIAGIGYLAANEIMNDLAKYFKV